VVSGHLGVSGRSSSGEVGATTDLGESSKDGETGETSEDDERDGSANETGTERGDGLIVGRGGGGGGPAAAGSGSGGGLSRSTLTAGLGCGGKVSESGRTGDERGGGKKMRMRKDRRGRKGRGEFRLTAGGDILAGVRCVGDVVRRIDKGYISALVTSRVLGSGHVGDLRRENVVSRSSKREKGDVCAPAW
jgi:hypothetical protein